MSLESRQCTHCRGMPPERSILGVDGHTGPNLSASRCLTSVIVRAAIPMKKAVGRGVALLAPVPLVRRSACGQIKRWLSLGLFVSPALRRWRQEDLDEIQDR